MPQDIMDTTALILFKLTIIGLIHSALFLALMEGALRQKSSLFFITSTRLNQNLPQVFHRVGIAILVGLIVAGLSMLFIQFSGLQTMMVFNAAALTLWYLEAGLMLARGFFTRLLGHDLPPSMVTFVSFVLMVNAGYFTLMFMISLMRSSSII